jgi:hypothetical protein
MGKLFCVIKGLHLSWKKAFTVRYSKNAFVEEMSVGKMRGRSRKTLKIIGFLNLSPSPRRVSGNSGLGIVEPTHLFSM